MTGCAGAGAATRPASAAVAVHPAAGLASAAGLSMAASIPTCRTSGLTLQAGHTGHAAGTVYTTFRLINESDRTCALQGFPGVSLRDARGHLVGRPAGRTGQAGSTIHIPAGRRAHFTFDDNTATQTGCTMDRPAAQIQVYPPNRRTALRIPFVTAFCTLTVTSVRR